ncbi:hypothetical protein MHBO_000156 [Bonamia ostreae]|uniref:Uncharacterized protein n=1 Tax=Bonamia ostreae TaxID=126728 RepID=A0ABV2AFA8_9EUKA
MNSKLIVKSAEGHLKSFFQPFSRPENVSNLFVLSCQRACYDRPHRWPWYYTRYNPHFKSFQNEDPFELAKYFVHICNLLNEPVTHKFCSEMENSLNRKLRGHILSNDVIHKTWQEKLLGYSSKRKRYLKNPYLDMVEFLSGTMRVQHPFLFVRDAASQIFGKAIPSDAAIQQIAKIAPKIVECGYATSGYWSYMLKQVGCDVKCLTVGKPYLQKSVEWDPIKPIVDVRPGDFFEQTNCDDYALLFVWPHVILA